MAANLAGGKEGLVGNLKTQAELVSLSGPQLVDDDGVSDLSVGLLADDDGGSTSARGGCSCLTAPGMGLARLDGIAVSADAQPKAHAKAMSRPVTGGAGPATEMSPSCTGSAGYRRPTAPGQVLRLPASPEVCWRSASEIRRHRCPKSP
jgi:hypothetical protein